MLARQLKYDFELVNNNDFWEWAGFIEGETLDDEAQYWTEQFAEVFGSYIDDDETGVVPLEEIYFVRPIREVKSLSRAMYYLYQFRYFRNLEQIYHWGHRRQLLSYAFISSEEYEMCTEPTKQQAEILT